MQTKHRPSQTSLKPALTDWSQVSWRRVSPSTCLLPTNGARHRTIQFEGFHCGPALWTESHDALSLPSKMDAPGVQPGVKNGSLPSGLGIGDELPGALSKRAGDTRESQVIKRGSASCRDRRDVINMKRRLLTFLGDSAVFTAISRAMDHLAPEAQRDEHGFSLRSATCPRSGGATTTTVRPSQPGPRPRVVPLQRGALLRPACRGDLANASRPPWADGISPDHPGVRFQTECALTWPLPLSLAKRNARPPSQSSRAFSSDVLSVNGFGRGEGECELQSSSIQYEHSD